MTIPVLPLSTILASLGQAAFVWDVVSDEMVWSDHVSSVFPDIPVEALTRGTQFETMIEPLRSVRSDALAH
ncbi:MAG TPA: GGDEF-domain containing protein, partial [Bradyrhizobium sp.]|nr:GGDEF-domain containing protein [Bradyrhizobium sp.]